MIKKQSVVALVLLLLIPLVLALGGMLFSLINPEIAAGHPNYARNFHLLSQLKIMCFLASVVGAARVVDACVPLVIRSKKRSYLWLFLTALGPIGSDVLATLKDRACGGDRQICPVRAQPELGCARRLRTLHLRDWHGRSPIRPWSSSARCLIRYEAATTGVSTAQIIEHSKRFGWNVGV